MEVRDRFQEENNQVGLSFLEHTLFRGWSGSRVTSWSRMELFLGGRCNLACKYCYINRHGSELFPLELEDDRTVLKNTEMLVDWLIKNDYCPDFDIFSGEPLIGYRVPAVLDMMIDKFSGRRCRPTITIPTNMTFLLSSEQTSRVVDLINRGKKAGIPILLSASIDGKYCESNRPMKTGLLYGTDEFYDRVWDFGRSHGLGFHPMLYSENIERWQDNFLWFQEMHKKYNIFWQAIYLLEVRNPEWSVKATLKFAEFIRFLIRWTYGMCNSDIAELKRFLFGPYQGFNILGSTLSSTDRGLGCSLQTTMVVRVGDLGVFPCHRTSYSMFQYSRFITDGSKITGLEIINPELMISLYTFLASDSPMCEVCLIKDLCSLGCLGSQFETTGDLFSPIPTVCRLEHAKVIAMIETYKELGIFDSLFDIVNRKKKFAMEELYELRRGKGQG